MFTVFLQMENSDLSTISIYVCPGRSTNSKRYCTQSHSKSHSCCTRVAYRIQ